MGLVQAKQALYEAIILPLCLPKMFDNKLLRELSTCSLLLYGPPGVGVSDTTAAV